MASFLLTHNPAYSDQPVAGEVGSWSFGNRRQGVNLGDMVWLMRLGKTPWRGLIAQGIVASGTYQAPHWRVPYQVANYAIIKWVKVMEPDDVFPLDDLRAIFPKVNWLPQQSGTLLPDEVATELKKQWTMWNEWLFNFDLNN